MGSDRAVFRVMFDTIEPMLFQRLPMADFPLLQFHIGLEDSSLDDADRLRFSKQLLPELRQLATVERADRTAAIAEAGAKAGFTTLTGWLTAEVSVENIVGFLGWIGQRLLRQPAAKVKVKIGDDEVTLESQDLADPEATALKLIAALKG